MFPLLKRAIRLVRDRSQGRNRLADSCPGYFQPCFRCCIYRGGVLDVRRTRASLLLFYWSASVRVCRHRRIPRRRGPGRQQRLFRVRSALGADASGAVEFLV